MFLLDTALISEVWKVEAGTADAGVITWSQNIDVGSSFLSVVTIMELSLGIHGVERRDPVQSELLHKLLTNNIFSDFNGRILPITETVALRCAKLHANHLLNERDAWIAATALVNGLTVVTRDVAAFGQIEVPLLNPWSG